MKKFWNTAANEIYIYGDIVSGEKYGESEVTAQSFTQDLQSFNGEDIIIHVNSNGGSVFDAVAIYNAIKNYSGAVEIQIDGIAASAASIICCAGNVVKMASNALLMIHEPSVSLVGNYEAAELEKVSRSLEAVRESILTTYEKRTGKSRMSLEELIKRESWLSAAEALANNFIDEVTDKVEATVSNHRLYINKMEVKGDISRLAEMTGAVEVVEDKVADAVKAERQRIIELNERKGKNAAANKIIDIAISEGKTLPEIKKYLEAVESTRQNNLSAQVLQDNLESGAENLTSGGGANNAARLTKYVNERLRAE